MDLLVLVSFLGGFLGARTFNAGKKKKEKLLASPFKSGEENDLIKEYDFHILSSAIKKIRVHAPHGKSLGQPLIRVDFLDSWGCNIRDGKENEFVVRDKCYILPIAWNRLMDAERWEIQTILFKHSS